MAGLQHDTIDEFQCSLAVARPASMHAAKMILPSSSVLPHILDYFALLMSKIAAVLAKAVRLMTR
eukprot:scaffold36682_cov255-Skeletonema_dohrnii-CCMP3373.AAC.1